MSHNIRDLHHGQRAKTSVHEAPADLQGVVSTLCRPLQRISSSSGGESSCDDGVYRKPCLPHPSSRTEHWADTVIYVGPNQEAGEGEAPPTPIPIIPSLNRKCVWEEPAGSGSGNHFKCNTFAELQEKLDCVDGCSSEGPVVTQSEAVRTAHDPGCEPPTAAGLLEASTSRAEKLLVPPTSAAVVDQTGLPSASFPAGNIRSNINLQQPVELNGEDELVLTLVEELPSDLLGSSRGRSLQTVTSGWQPLSIISSISDEYEAFTSLAGCEEQGTSLTYSNRPRPRDHSGQMKSLEQPQALQPSGPPGSATHSSTVGQHQHRLLETGSADPSGGRASYLAWTPSSSQVTLGRPAGHRSSTIRAPKLQEPSSDLLGEQRDSIIEPTGSPENFWNPEAPSGTTRSSSLGEKSSLPIVTISKQSLLEQKSWSRLHSLTGQRSSTLRSPLSPTRISGSLKVHGAKQQSSRRHSRNSMELTSGTPGKTHLPSCSSSQDPPEGFSNPRGHRKPHTGRGTFPGTKLAISRRLVQLAAVSWGKQRGGRSHHTAKEGGSASEAPPPSPTPPPPASPYSVVKPRKRPSSSSELLPGATRTVLLHRGGGAASSSSGYGSSSVAHDSETDASSAHDSPGDGGPSSASRSRAFRSPRKKGSGEWGAGVGGRK